MPETTWAPQAFCSRGTPPSSLLELFPRLHPQEQILSGRICNRARCPASPSTPSLLTIVLTVHELQHLQGCISLEIR